MCAQWYVVAGAEISKWVDGMGWMGWDGWDDEARNGATMQDQDICQEDDGNSWREGQTCVYPQ